MITVLELAESLGRKRIADRLGVGLAAVSKQIGKDEYPAGWYFVLSEMCAERGLECPRSLFNFKTPSPVSPDEGFLPKGKSKPGAGKIQEAGL